jgi:predicted RNA-binding protein with PIN domain
MTNKIIIDAWNVIWKMPSLSSLIPEKLEQVRTKFNQMIKNLYFNKQVTFKIIYDGQPLIYSEDQKQCPNVTFSRNPEKADDVIIKFLNKQSAPEQWTVVTSDRYLSHRVKNTGAQITSTESFIARIQKSVKKNQTPDSSEDLQIKKEDITYWLDKFDSTK